MLLCAFRIFQVPLGETRADLAQGVLRASEQHEFCSYRSPIFICSPKTGGLVCVEALQSTTIASIIMTGYTCEESGFCKARLHSLHHVQDVGKVFFELKEKQTQSPPSPALQHICQMNRKWRRWMDVVLNLWNKLVNE